MNRIVHVFFETDMRNGLDGLFKIAKKQGVNPDLLDPGEFLVFINVAKDKMRVWVSGNMYAHYRTSNRAQINMAMIQHLPKAFNGTSFNFTEALKRALLKEEIK